MSYYRKGEDRPVLSGRAARRADLRCEARNTARAHKAPVIGHHQRALIAAGNADAANYILARDFLVELGCTPEFVTSYESWFGRHVAKQFRKKYRRDPDNGHRLVINGRIRHVNRYWDPADLMAGARAYRRTAVFLGIPTAAVPKPRAPRRRQFVGV